ncbi:hypothetical protein Q3G72_027934 [Acer saccharum]|nr:hypothetical protein Q3G72_027934 [Acer saccharum]
MLQQPESGAVQPNVSPSSQQQAESGGIQIQPNVSPSLQQPAENGGVQVQPNVSPSSQQQAQSGGVQIQPNVSPSLQQPTKSGGVQVQPNVSPSSQQQAESGGALVQPNVSTSSQQQTESGGEIQLNEVEKIIKFPFLRDKKNKKGKTAHDVFRKAHEDLAEKGEKWMKDTAKSCMLVSTLIATVLFAAAFTVPGGNSDDNGIPIFLRTDAFAVFAISAALGLFSSLTSLLMFLSILTARYTQEDFLKSLPTKLITGLGSLFFAIAAMIIAFGATLTIVLSKNWHWVSVPITLMATFPVAIFVILQLPLFIQMVWSTYGSGMFHP